MEIHNILLPITISDDHRQANITPSQLMCCRVGSRSIKVSPVYYLRFALDVKSQTYHNFDWPSFCSSARLSGDWTIHSTIERRSSRKTFQDAPVQKEVAATPTKKRATPSRISRSNSRSGDLQVASVVHADYSNNEQGPLNNIDAKYSDMRNLTTPKKTQKFLRVVPEEDVSSGQASSSEMIVAKDGDDSEGQYKGHLESISSIDLSRE